MSNQALVKIRATPAAGKALEKRASQDFGSLDFEAIVRMLRPSLTIVIGLWAAIGVAGFFLLLSLHPAYALPFGVISASAWALAFLWQRSGGSALPLIPLFAFQNGLIYGLPLLVRNESLIGYSEELLWPATFSFLIYMGSVGFGWRVGRGRRPGAPARWRFGLAGGARSRSKGLANAGFFLLGASLVFEILIRSGLYWSWLGSVAAQLFPVARMLFDAAMLIGALLGGFASGSKPARVAYWGLIGLLFLFKVSDLLLSSVLGLVLAATIGLLFGTRRIPIMFLAVTLGVVGFLNQSKFLMRDRYWDKETNSAMVGMAQLPVFYAEWARASSSMLLSSGGAGGRDAGAQRGAESGQSFYNRIDNLQNLLYVTEALNLKNISSLNGEGYGLIPPLLIPRAFWPDKPRTHEGQILLNLHFGRQSSVEETEHTNIAWGLLPEAVGNLGLNTGPLLLGLVLGWILGRLETWSRRKQILSVEGLLCLALLLQTALCFEMAASVLVTSTFQLVLAVTLAGFLLRAYMLKTPSRAAKAPGRDALA